MQSTPFRFLRAWSWLLATLLLASLTPAAVYAQTPGATFTGAGWQANYWNNITLDGAPVLTRTDADVNFNWGLGAPAPEITVDNFSARWTRTLEVTQPGSYRFTLNSDDGSRLFIDGELVINAWYDHGPSRTFSTTRTLNAGSHEVRIEYYERRGAASVRFGWAQVGAAPATPATPTVPTPPPPPAANQPVSSGQWRGEYYNNRDLLGAPALVRGDAQIDFNWGFGSPAVGVINADNFSVRWTNRVNFPSGFYRFRVTVDDGARVFVNDQLVIDAWRVQGVATFDSGDIALGGNVPLRVEYFEDAGEARVTLTWFPTGGVTPPTPAPPPAGDIWTAEYFNNPDLANAPVLVRGEGGAIDYNWGVGSPAPGVVNSDFFSARWNRVLNLGAGAYRFRVLVDDGVRLYVNNQLLINQWRQQAPTEFTADITLPGGAVPVRLEYVEFTGNAQVRLTWETVGGGGGVATPAPEWSQVKPPQSYVGEYFANRDLSGAPALVRQDRDIDFDWGNDAPGPGVPADNFSVRWTNTLRLDKGRYRFTVETDDGVRLFINDRLVIDKWRVQSRTKHTYESSLDGGDYRIRMEYFDEGGAAFARLRIEVRKEPSGAIGNIITCVPPQPQNYAWIKLYRLNSANQWVAIGRGIGSINPTGYLKIDGLPVDVNRFGGAGEPYKVEQWVDNRVVQSTGDFLRGEPEFRVRAFADNYTPWRCTP
ncbi:MAG TPA: hypothetical protein GYA08_12055 [Chloroflexi bacterium]|nr:hypothetical protein [Chloroflexota bacterium]